MESNAAEALKQAHCQLADSMVAEVKSVLSRAMPVEWSNGVQDGLREVFCTAHQFYRLLQCQRAVFHVEMPMTVIDDVTQVFNPGSMEDNSSTDDEATLAGRPLEMSVFPAVYKRGSAKGENVSLKIGHVLLESLVLTSRG